MMGLYRQQFIPADPPTDGRYIVWVKGDPEWREAYIYDGEWVWTRGEGPADNVHYYMDLGSDAS